MRKIYHWINRAADVFAAIMLAGMVLIVFLQVVTRYFFAYTPSWSEETSLLLMVWFGFMGVSIGVGEKLHLKIEVATKGLPEKVRWYMDKFALLFVVGMGVFMTWQGWKLVQVTSLSTMAGTKLPSSVLYFAIPLSGALVILHAVIQFLGLDSKEEAK